MTNKEAAEWIKYHISISDYDENDGLLKALKKAIECLEREDRKRIEKMKSKECFINAHCSYDCPNFQIDCPEYKQKTEDTT